MENYSEGVIINSIGWKIKSMRNRVIWIPRMYGGTTALLGTWKKLIVKALKRSNTFDYVIEIMAQPPKEEAGSEYTHAKEQRMIAEKLGILDEEDGALRRLLESRDELDYYQYLDDHDGVEQRGLSQELATKIFDKLTGKKYLLVFEHVDRPIEQTFLTVEMGLPTPSKHNGCWWLISTLSDGICSTSKSAADLVLNPYLEEAPKENGIDLLRVEAQDILSTIPLISGRKEDKILDCLFYSFMFIAPPRTQDELDGVQDGDEYGIKEDELVRFWMEEEFITELVSADADNASSHLFDTGKAIMEKFITRSLLQADRHPPFFIILTNVMRIFYSKAIQTFYNHNIHKWWFWRNSEVPSYKELKKKKHISLFQLNLTQNCLLPLVRCTELTTLILRGCSNTHSIPDDFFQYMPLLRILDLSYTDLTFVPLSVSYLHHLRLLTLRGCHKLTNLLLPSCSQPSSSSSSSSSSLRPSPEHHPLLNLHVLDVSCTNIASLSTTLHMPNLTDFFLDGCTALLDPPPFLPSLNNLRVLRLTGTQITTFPESIFSCMEWLRVLDLSNNHRLVSLPRSLSKARLLEELHIDSCKALKEINEIGSAKFRTFSLSDNDSMTSLPESLSKIAALEKVHLQDCRALKGIDAIGGTKLRILSLTNIAFLTSLPDSLSKVDSLEELHITDCRALMKIDAVDGAKLKIFRLLNNDKLTSSPEWFSTAKSLEKLHLQNCRAMEKINIADNASMRSFFLSGSPIVELSLHGCKNLETVELHDLEELEVLDLSFTRISELPANIFNDLPKLRYFCMVGAKNLRRFPWHQIQHLPKEFIFDHCSCRGRRRPDGDDDNNKARAHIFVDDPRFFLSLKEEDCRRLIGNQVRRRLNLEFHVTIIPCEQRCNKEEAPEASSSCGFIQERWNFPYKDIYLKWSELKRVEEQHRPNARLWRHLTMEGVVDDGCLPAYSGGNFRLLDFIDSLSISDDKSVVSLSDMSPTMKALKECILTQCHNMESVVVFSHSLWQRNMESVEILWVSGLGKLTKLFSLSDKISFAASELENLKHVHIEYCPRVEKLFPNNTYGGVRLPYLETLTIKFCDSLREITYKERRKENSVLFPRLHTLILLELPKLVHFREDLPDAELPSLKRLHVRGCWRLRRLPLLLHPGDHQSKEVVEVSGEQKWWNKLTWDHYRDEYAKNRFLIRFKPQAKFYTWEPTIRGRSRKKKKNIGRLRTTTTTILR